jgi:hypothetical protein
MRCRKVRSFLSAFCNDELTGRKRLAVREHLATCSSCRQELAVYQSISQASREAAGLRVSEDFNVKLLNRIAQERFQETRTRAYFPPSRVPVLSWGRLAPVLSTVAALLVVSMTWWAMSGPSGQPGRMANADLTEDWLSAEPENNPNITRALDKDWSFSRSIQRNDHLARLSNSITRQVGFNDMQLVGITFRTTRQAGQVPYVTTYFRVQPIIRVYQSSNRTVSQEDDKIF